MRFVLVFLFGVFVTGIGLHTAIKFFRSLRWKSIFAIVRSSDVQVRKPLYSTTMIRQFEPVIIYSFTLDSKTYTSKKIAFASVLFYRKNRAEQFIASLIKDGQVKVFYDPKNPKDAILVHKGLLTALIFIVFGSLFVFGSLTGH